MNTDLIFGALMIAVYFAVDFLVFKYFLRNQKGLIQILFEKYKGHKKFLLNSNKL